VYIKKETKQVGLHLSYSEITVNESQEGKETKNWENIRGALVIPVTPINTSTRKVDLVVNQSKGKQEYTAYENEKGELVKEAFLEDSSSFWAQAGLSEEGPIALETNKPLTIKA
jgi:hypothetical protein